MERNNIIFVAIIGVIALIVVGVVINENFCNCLGTGMKYSSPTFGTLGGYKNDYGWPVGTPFDSFSRQMIAESNPNVCAPNVFGANKLSCTGSTDTTTMKDDFKASKACSGNPDYGSVLSMQNKAMPINSTSSHVMLQGPEVSYKATYTADRGPGRYGYGTTFGGMAAYGSGSSGCGFKLFSAPPQSALGPAGSFTQRPAQVEGECSGSQGYNLAIGVM